MRWGAALLLFAGVVAAGDGVALVFETTYPRNGGVRTIEVVAAGEDLALRTDRGLTLFKDGVVTICDLRRRTHVVIDEEARERLRRQRATGTRAPQPSGPEAEKRYAEAKADLERRLQRVPEAERAAVRKAMQPHLDRLEPARPPKLENKGAVDLQGVPCTKYVLVGEDGATLAEIFTRTEGEGVAAAKALQAFARAARGMPWATRGLPRGVADVDGLVHLVRNYRNGELWSEVRTKRVKPLAIDDRTFAPPEGSEQSAGRRRS